MGMGLAQCAQVSACRRRTMRTRTGGILAEGEKERERERERERCCLGWTSLGWPHSSLVQVPPRGRHHQSGHPADREGRGSIDRVSTVNIAPVHSPTSNSRPLRVHVNALVGYGQRGNSVEA
jgi:hypothetical protein